MDFSCSEYYMKCIKMFKGLNYMSKRLICNVMHFEYASIIKVESIVNAIFVYYKIIIKRKQCGR